MHDRKFKNLIGQRFNKLSVIELIGKTSTGKFRWRYRCDCGNETAVVSGDLRTGHVRSCGCLKNRDKLRHGHNRSNAQKSPEYRAWANMLSRYRTPGSSFYADYGGRGITVCERWLDFRNFLADMGSKPSARHSIERDDTDGNYGPSNCRWATPVEQANNKRNTVLVTAFGLTKPIRIWARETGLDPRSLYARIHSYGWTPERALAEPARTGRWSTSSIISVKSRD